MTSTAGSVRGPSYSLLLPGRPVVFPSLSDKKTFSGSRAVPKSSRGREAVSSIETRVKIWLVCIMISRMTL